MNPWANAWWNSIKAPWSGDVDQVISPITQWLSPQIDFNFAGNRDIEAKVVTEVASYGKQLGIMSEAVLEIASGKPGSAVERLKEINDQIEAIKETQKSKLQESIKSDIAKLKEQDPEAFKNLIDEFTKP